VYFNLSRSYVSPIVSRRRRTTDRRSFFVSRSSRRRSLFPAVLFRPLLDALIAYYYILVVGRQLPTIAPTPCS